MTTHRGHFASNEAHQQLCDAFCLRRRVRNGRDRTSRCRQRFVSLRPFFSTSGCVSGWFIGNVSDGPIFSALPDLTTRRPSFRYQVWQQLRFHYCSKSVLQIKSVAQYGFALGCQAAQERSKKTERPTKPQTSEAFAVWKESINRSLRLHFRINLLKYKEKPHSSEGGRL